MGTHVHSLIERVVKGGVVDKQPIDIENSINLAMDVINGIRTRFPGGHEGVEDRVGLDAYDLAEVWGTMDYRYIVYGHSLFAVDYKNGVIPVPADSPQLLTYALGAAGKFLDDFQQITTCVIQPNALEGPPVKWHTMTPWQLRHWLDHVLRPAIAEAKSPHARAIPGEYQCRWCPAKSNCPEYRDKSLAVAKLEYKALVGNQTPVIPSPEEMTPEQLADVYTKLPLLTDWIKHVQAVVASRLEKGKPVPGYKRVAGKNKRSWRDEEAAKQFLLDNTPNEVMEEDMYSKPTFLSPAQAEKLIPRTSWKDLSEFVELTPGKPAIVPESHKKEALTSSMDEFKKHIKTQYTQEKSQ